MKHYSYPWILFFLVVLSGNAFAGAQDKIIFLHIPKAGGVTVSSLLMNEYEHDQIVNSDIKKINLRAYGFHYSLFEIEKELDISEFKLITFLRNPVDRILSEHKYCIGKHHGAPEILIAHRLPPYGDPIETASNVVCKMLSGLNNEDPLIPIETHLEYAKKALEEKFFFIGITENMEESIHLLYTQLDWPLPKNVPHFNATEDNVQFSESVLAGIANRNWADIELYQYGKTLYQERKRLIKSLKKNPLAASLDYIPQLHYTFDQELKGYGWGVRELNTDSSMYRWASENNEACLYFYLDPKINYFFSCRILIQPIFQEQMNVLINDCPILLSTDCIDNKATHYEWISFSGIIPKENLKQDNKTQIVFKMTPPADSALLQFYDADAQQQNVYANYKRGKFACREIKLEKQKQ